MTRLLIIFQPSTGYYAAILTHSRHSPSQVINNAFYNPDEWTAIYDFHLVIANHPDGLPDDIPLTDLPLIPDIT